MSRISKGVMKLTIKITASLIILISAQSFAMQQNKQSPFADALLAPLNKAKEEKYDAHYERELKKLNEKYEAKKARMQKKHAEWVQQILQAVHAKTSMNNLYTIKPYGSTHYKAVSIPLIHKMAKKSECVELLRLMLDNGADPNLNIGFFSPNRPLNWAIAGKAYCNIKLLIERKAATGLDWIGDYARKAIEEDPELKRLIGGSDNTPVNK